jgi:hypothetical protein
MTENVVREFAENGAARAKDATKVMEQTYSAPQKVPRTLISISSRSPRRI